jgi:uncharacterized damage-inducible protein DinB
MRRVLVDDLMRQYRHSFRILYEEMARFNAEQWQKGLSFFMTPVNLAMHITDCLDFYFHPSPIKPYVWGHRFGGGWWELKAEQRPTQAALAEYTRELEARILAILGALDDAALGQPYPAEASQSLSDEGYATWLGHYVYALRHTLHHHGELAALATFHGYEGGAWD